MEYEAIENFLHRVSIFWRGMYNQNILNDFDNLIFFNKLFLILLVYLLCNWGNEKQ